MKAIYLLLLAISCFSCHRYISLPLKLKKARVSRDYFIQMLEKNDPMYIENLKQIEPSKILEVSIKLGDQPLNLEIDTYNDISWVSGVSDPNSQKYECKESCKKKTTLAIDQQKSPGAIPLTQSAVSGIPVTDTLTLNKVQINEFPFFVGSKVTVNAARKSDGVLSLGYLKDSGLLHELKKQKKINKEVFSVYMGSEKNILTLGSHEEYFANNDKQVFAKAVKQSKWALTASKISFDKENADKLVVNTDVYIDFANEGVYFPKGKLESIKTSLNSILPSTGACSIVSGNIQCPCTNMEKFPSLSLQFLNDSKASNPISLAGQSLLIKEKETCRTLFFEGPNADSMVIGRILADDHSIVFNQEEQIITISSEYKTNIDSHEIPSDISTAVIVVGAFFIVAAIVALIVILKPVQLMPSMNNKVSIR